MGSYYPISSRLSESVTKEAHNLILNILLFELSFINPIALRTAKTPWSFGRSECNRVMKGCKNEDSY